VVIDAVAISVASILLAALTLILTQRHQGKVDTKTDAGAQARMDTKLDALSKSVDEIKTDTKSLLERVTRLESK